MPPAAGAVNEYTAPRETRSARTRKRPTARPIQARKGAKSRERPAIRGECRYLQIEMPRNGAFVKRAMPGLRRAGWSKRGLRPGPARPLPSAAGLDPIRPQGVSRLSLGCFNVRLRFLERKLPVARIEPGVLPTETTVLFDLVLADGSQDAHGLLHFHRT